MTCEPSIGETIFLIVFGIWGGISSGLALPVIHEIIYELRYGWPPDEDPYAAEHRGKVVE